MAVDTFIPEVWSAELLIALRKTLIYGQDRVVNRNYEGEIREQGDTVHISSLGAVTTSPYVRNTDIAPPEQLNTTEQLLTITQARYFNFAIDDVDAAQAQPGLMQGGMTEAAYALADVADQYLHTTLRDGVAAANVIGTAAAPKILSAAQDANNVYDTLVDLGVLLSDAKVPTTGRWIIVTPKFHGLLQKVDEFTKASDLGDDVVVNGLVGRAAGFDIMVSHNIPTIGVNGTVGNEDRKALIAGTNRAATFAEQINKTEAYRPPLRFADAVKGLHVYGAKVTRPTELAMILADATSV